VGPAYQIRIAGGLSSLWAPPSNLRFRRDVSNTSLSAFFINFRFLSHECKVDKVWRVKKVKKDFAAITGNPDE
jgi:hypothetical protein